MEEKLWRVTLWLKKIYGNEPIPQYEVNARTVDILHDLAEFNEARDRDVSLLIEYMKQKEAEYEAEANYLAGLLTESLDLSESSLSKEGIRYLNVLVDTAMTLEMKDTSLASCFCAIDDLTSELYAAESENREIKLESSKIKEKLTAVLMLEKKLAADLKKTEVFLEIENAKADSRSKNLEFLKNKSEDFKNRIKAAEDQLAAMALDQSLTHESLVSLSEKLAEQQEEIVVLKKKLEFYLDLPPNLSLAQVKIEEVKRELNTLEEELSKEVSSLTFEM
ncbi:HAUS augmin-like complex subunit 1 isoform X2 [Grus americana]|uniref:HAUS augmin-like complex subunit 1 n=1 Tax=Grus japonensis TaxID=30415 RepID=A0ABC9Y0R4_GRUJA|nr:HAUS augmin-like complex subunit 1 isoform X2 [Grus americana]